MKWIRTAENEFINADQVIRFSLEKNPDNDWRIVAETTGKRSLIVDFHADFDSALRALDAIVYEIAEVVHDVHDVRKYDGEVED